MKTLAWKSLDQGNEKGKIKQYRFFKMEKKIRSMYYFKERCNKNDFLIGQTELCKSSQIRFV